AGIDRRISRSAQLRLFEVPVLDGEDVVRGKRLVSAEGCRAQDYVDGVRVDVEGNVGLARAGTSCHHPEIWVEDHARRRIEHLQRLLALGGVLGEVALVVRSETADIAAEL